MIERAETIELLKDIRDRGSRIAEGPPLSDEFLDWYGRVLFLAEEIFGSGSDFLTELKSVNVEAPPELIQSASNNLYTILQNEERRSVEELIQSMQEQTFRSKIFEICEVVSAMIMTIQKQCK